MTSPTVTLTFGNRLSAQSWVAALQNFPGPTPHSPASWRARFANAAVTLDLSAVGFADFVALGRILNLIDAITAVGSTVLVRLPNSEPLDGEISWSPAPGTAGSDRLSALLHQTARRQRQRHNCRLFMKQAGFENALAEGPWPGSAVRVIEGHASSAEPGLAPGANADDQHMEESQLPHRLRKILPFQWVPPIYGAGLTSSDRIASLVAGLTSLGLSSEDSATLAQGVLAELIENVAEHAQASSDGPVMALVGGLVVEPDMFQTRVDDFSPHLRGFVKWAAQAGSPLVRLLVADRGAGLLATLRPKIRPAGQHAPASVRSGSTSEQRDAILVAFDRWSTLAGSARGLRLPARGLWKIKRIIRSYQGSLLIHTGARVSGLVFDESPSGREITGVRPVWTPGTFVECDILTRPSHEMSQTAEELSSPAGEAVGSRPRLTCKTIQLRRGAGLDSGDLEEASLALAALPNQRTSGMVIAVDTPGGGEGLSDTEIRESLREIVAIASDASNPATVTLAFPSISRRLLSLAVEDLNIERESSMADTSGLHNPVLVVTHGNRHLWAGGSSELRLLLRSLSSNASPLRLADMAEGHRPGAARPAVLREIRDHAGLLQIEAGMLSLKLRPEGALNALAEDLGSRLFDALMNANIPGVERGLFLTPSLRLVTRWCNIGELLARLRAERLAGFLLAARLEARVGRFDLGSRPPAIVRVGNPRHELVQGFARSLTGADDYFESVENIRLERDEGPNSAWGPVVMFTDLVSTSRGLYREVAALRAYGVTPAAVVTVIDGRDVRTHRGSPDEIELGIRLPLVSLSVADLEFREASDVTGEPVPIDPVLDRPVRVPRSLPRALALQPFYLEALARTGGARLGHIWQPPGRHFTAYVDPTLLFGLPSWANHVISLARHRIMDAHTHAFPTPQAPHGEPEHSIGILYPTDTNDDIAQVARSLADDLGAHGLPVVATIPVPRAVRGSKWRFPAALPLPPEVRHMVVIDSGTVSGRSAQQLVRIAAGPEVRAITAVILLNGLNDLDAIAVQQVRAVQCIQPGRAGTSAAAGAGGIPVSLHFVARTAMGAIDSKECPVCRLRSRYGSLPRTLPTSIEEHRGWLLQSLRLRSKDRAFAEEATDLLGMPISQDECIEYLRWRSNLREAQYDTPSRRAVIDAVEAARAEAPRRNALVRLLAAETQWLDATPLWWPDVRGVVAELALSMVQGPSAWSADPALRVQALILLARADPGLFVGRIVQIAMSNQDHRLVVSHLLVETLLLVADSDAWSRFSHDELVRNLTTLEDRLREMVDSQGAQPLLLLDDVRHVATLSRRTLNPIPTDPQSAWGALRRCRSSLLEHTFDAAMWRLEVTVLNLTRGLAPRNPESVRLDWDRCSDFLCVEVLPNLEPLRRILLRGRLTRGLSRDDASMWTRVVNGDGPSLLDQMGLKLNEILLGSGHDAVANEGIQDVADGLRWWNRFFLATHADPDHPGRGAFLTEVASQCPAKVLDIARSVFEACDCDFVPVQMTDDEALSVFCTDSLFRDVLTHVRINAEIHRSGAAMQRFSLRLRDADDGRINVTIRNTGSMPSGRGGGRGLALLRSELLPFGADLSATPETEAPWTFEVSVNLERWRGN